MVLGILNACVPGAWKGVGEIPLIARTLYHLDKLGLTADLPIRSQQKQVLDISARSIHHPLENVLTAQLTETPVTPNGVMIIVTSPGFLISRLFWHNYLLMRAFLTVFVYIPDGVGGNLARARLQYRQLGEHEDIIYNFYKNSWYIIFNGVRVL